MSRCKLLKDTFNVERLTEEAEDKEGFTTHLEDVKGFFQPLDEEFTGESEIDKWVLYTTRQDIRDTDTIVYNGVNYSVASIKDYNYGSFPHLRIILTKENA